MKSINIVWLSLFSILLTACQATTQSILSNSMNKQASTAYGYNYVLAAYAEHCPKLWDPVSSNLFAQKVYKHFGPEQSRSKNSAVIARAQKLPAKEYFSLFDDVLVKLKEDWASLADTAQYTEMSLSIPIVYDETRQQFFTRLPTSNYLAAFAYPHKKQRIKGKYQDLLRDVSQIRQVGLSERQPGVLLNAPSEFHEPFKALRNWTFIQKNQEAYLLVNTGSSLESKLQKLFLNNELPSISYRIAFTPSESACDSTQLIKNKLNLVADRHYLPGHLEREILFTGTTNKMRFEQYILNTDIIGLALTMGDTEILPEITLVK